MSDTRDEREDENAVVCPRCGQYYPYDCFIDGCKEYDCPCDGCETMRTIEN
tara:strand:+ start:343 stop:495 length:153 start_codon:yes stop_codon:yes gene_type:complete